MERTGTTYPTLSRAQRNALEAFYVGNPENVRSVSHLAVLAALGFIERGPPPRSGYLITREGGLWMQARRAVER